MSNSVLYDVELRESSSGKIVRTPNGRPVELKEPGTGAMPLTGRKVKEVENMKTDPAEMENKLVESFKRLGFSDEAARTAAQGRDSVPANAPVEERLTEAFKRIGLSESAARVAARGR